MDFSTRPEKENRQFLVAISHHCIQWRASLTHSEQREHAFCLTNTALCQLISKVQLSVQTGQQAREGETEKVDIV